MTSFGGNDDKEEHKIEFTMIRLVVEGKVQKVGYREWMRREATNLSISGWVKNRRDGSVESIIYGVKENVAKLIKLCQYGPPMSVVKRVKEFPYKHGNTPSGFRVISD